jgi:hypothetical protein
LLGTIASRIAVRNSGTLIARYGYDVVGRRIVKRVFSGISGGDPAYIRFVYRGDQVAYETDSAGTVGMRYSWGYGIDDLASFRDSTGTRYTTVQDPSTACGGWWTRPASGR